MPGVLQRPAAAVVLLQNLQQLLVKAERRQVIGLAQKPLAVAWKMQGRIEDLRAERQLHRVLAFRWAVRFFRSEEHTSELQSLMRISYAVFCLKKKKQTQTQPSNSHTPQTPNQNEDNKT